LPGSLPRFASRCTDRTDPGGLSTVGVHDVRRRVSYINIAGTFFFLCSILDGYSRFVVHWEIRETMKEAEVEPIIQRAREKYPGEHPRIITDNGPQSITRDFKEFSASAG
jgi:putative transposase